MKGRAIFFRPETIVASFFLFFFGLVLQSDIQLYFKTPVCGAPFSYKLKVSLFILKEGIFFEFLTVGDKTSEMHLL